MSVQGHCTLIHKKAERNAEHLNCHEGFPTERVICDAGSQGSVNLIITSAEDRASMNIRARLLESPGWTETGSFEDHPVMEKGDFSMIQIDRIHLEEDRLDERAQKTLGKDFDVMIYASRHKAASEIPTLTVHPVGNYSAAEFGGLPGTLCRAHGGFMTSALRALAREAQDMEFKISFETTHHGPFLEKVPAFFIEIGSSESFWEREDAAQAIAKSIMQVKDDGFPILLCVGGGHYAPRFTDIALSRKVAVGHMAANYALESLTEDMIRQMSERSGGAKMVYFHRKSMPKPKYRELAERFAALGIAEIRSDDLEPL
ncbi:transposase [Candidatus Bathyarchaeota archaeon]|nr:transposase [Candidatus Bathyarchaeota archaeon]